MKLKTTLLEFLKRWAPRLSLTIALATLWEDYPRVRAEHSQLRREHWNLQEFYNQAIDKLYEKTASDFLLEPGHVDGVAERDLFTMTRRYRFQWRGLDRNAQDLYQGIAFTDEALFGENQEHIARDVARRTAEAFAEKLEDEIFRIIRHGE